MPDICVTGMSGTVDVNDVVSFSGRREEDGKPLIFVKSESAVKKPTA